MSEVRACQLRRLGAALALSLVLMLVLRSDTQRGRARLTGHLVKGFDVVDDGEVSHLGTFRDRDTHRRKARIVGEADVKVGVPRDRGDLDRSRFKRDAWARSWKE